MKLKRTPIFGIFLLLIFASCHFLKKEKQVAKNEISGAYDALNFLGEARVYPFEEYPADAHFAAWQQVQNQAVSRNSAEPWESMGPHNRGGRTLNIAFNPQNPNTMYVGSASGGLWRTHTGGFGEDAWDIVETGFPVLGVSSIAFPPNDSMTIYIGTGEVYNFFAAGTGAAYRSTRGSYGMGILKSEDGGETWDLSLDWTTEQTRGIWAIRIDETDSNIVWAATTDGVYKSEDAGENWMKKLDVAMANDLLINPNDNQEIVAACGNLGSIGFGIYKSIDAGENWNKIEDGLPAEFLGKIQLAGSPSETDVLWASIGNGFSSADGATWLVKSTNFGDSWEIINQTDYSRWQGWFAHDVIVHPQDPEELTAIGIQIWKSYDSGETLNLQTSGGIGFANPLPSEPDGPPDFVHSDAHDIIYHPDDFNIMYVASDGGIHRSEDGGLTWRSVNGGYQTAQFYNGFSTSQNDSTFCLGGLQDNGTWIWNGDLTWTNIAGGDGAWTAIDPNTDETFFVSSQRLNVFKTTNGGDNFVFQDIPEVAPAAFIAPYVLDKINGNNIYAGTAVISKTTNQGTNWQIKDSPLFDGHPFLSMDISAQDFITVYAATAPYNGEKGHVYLTENGGNDWTDISGNLPDRYPMDIAVDPTDDAICYIVYSGFESGHVFRTDDHGENWEDISFGLPDVPTNAVIVDPLLPNVIYVGNDIGVFYSIDSGDTWEPYQEGLPAAIMVFDLKISNPNRKLRIASHGNGAYQRDLIDETVSTNEVVNNFDIQVFPNPFINEINVKYHLAHTQKVTINLTDSAGRTLKNLLNESQTLGNYEYQFSGADLSSGIYFLQIISEKGIVVERIVKD